MPPRRNANASSTDSMTSFMLVVGRWSWWMPAGLERRIPRVSIEGPPVPVTEKS